MTTTSTVEVPRITLDKIHTHPLNPRRDAVASDELVQSVGANGVLEPLMVAPAIDGDGWILIDGHRRYDAAVKADVASVPANPRYDLVTEAQQIEVMLITGLQKSLLTPVEEAAGYEQLTLIGMDAAAIAAATGFSKARVTSRMKLNGLNPSVLNKVHDGQLTLGDAEAMLEFADDPALTAELEKAAGTSNFRWQVETARSNRKRAEDQRETIAAFEVQGATELDKAAAPESYRPLSHWRDESLREADGHSVGDEGCLRWRMTTPFGSWGDPHLVCTDPARHPVEAEDRSEREAEWEKQRIEREARHAREDAAAKVRLAHLVEHFSGSFPAKTHQPLAKAAAAVLPLLLTDSETDGTTILNAFGAEPDGKSWDALADARLEVATGLAGASMTKTLNAFGTWLATVFASHLDTESRYVDDPQEIQFVLNLWDWLTSTGYQMSDVDTEIRTRLESKLLEADDEGGEE